MSRQPSPGPSQAQAAGTVFQTAPAPSLRQKSKPFAPGIAAGAEDVKYQAKYKELKRKVKEIESDNDKLQFKVLQAKKSINRMKIERAVLYDRLSQVPPSPEMNDRHPLPSSHSNPALSPHQQHHPGAHQHRDHREHVGMDDRTLMEYVNTHPNVRMATGPDGRPVPVQEIPMGPGVAPPPHSVHSSRHGPSSAHESTRQLPPLLQMAPAQHMEPPRSHGHPHSPHLAPLASSSRSHSHSHSRSHSRSRNHTQQSSMQYAQHAHPGDGLPPAQHIRSPSMSGERDRSRRHEGHERVVSHGEHHSRHQVSTSPHISTHSPPTSRASTRGHHPQRPGLSQVEMDREREEMEQWEYERRQVAQEQYDREQVARLRERERERETAHPRRIPTPPFGHRSSRQTIERPGDYHEAPSYRTRDEQSYHRETSGPIGPPRLSRSDTPGSGSGSGAGEGPPGVDSRAHIYERDRTRSYASRHPPPEDEYARDDHSGLPRDRNRSGGYTSAERTHSETRKRNHHEMEVDGENEGEASSVTGGGGSRKRVHQENTSARGADSQEEDEDMDA